PDLGQAQHAKEHERGKNDEANVKERKQPHNTRNERQHTQKTEHAIIPDSLRLLPRHLPGHRQEEKILFVTGSVLAVISSQQQQKVATREIHLAYLPRHTLSIPVNGDD